MTILQGTWAFMSALRQQYPKKPYEVSDDIESFVHVLIWCATRYLDHTWSTDPTGLATFINQMFIACNYSSDGTYFGGSGKWDVIKSGNLPFTFPGEVKLQTVLDQVLRVCRLHYEHLDLQNLAQFLPSDRVPTDKPEFTPGTTNTQISEIQVDVIEYEPPVQIDNSLRVSSDLPPDPLSKHKTIYNILITALNDRNAWPSALPKKDHLSTLKNVVFTEGKTVVTGTESSNRKRQRLPSVTDSTKGWKRKCGTSGTSSIQTSGSGVDDMWADADPTELVMGADDAEDNEEVVHMLTVSNDFSEEEV